MKNETLRELTNRVLNKAKQASEVPCQKLQDHYNQKALIELFPNGFDASQLLTRDFLLGYDISKYPTTHTEMIEDMQMALKLSSEGSLIETLARKKLTDYWNLHNLN